MEKSLLVVVAAVSAALLSSCSDTGTATVQKTASKFGQGAQNFAASPAGQVLISSLVSAAVNSTLNVGLQYGTTGKVDPKQIVLAAYDGSASMLRTLPNTPPLGGQVAQVVAQGSGVATVTAQIVAPVSSSIAQQVAGGTQPAVAANNVAVVLNSIAANPQVVATPTPAPTP